MKCLNRECDNNLLPHEGRDPRRYYHGYCDPCCKERKRESDEEDAQFTAWLNSDDRPQENAA
jgi:hypothetical protein